MGEGPAGANTETVRLMDRSEKVAKTYLERFGFKDICYEPDGNVPPDFLCDGRVAVEVRRLNQQRRDISGQPLGGVEEKAIPLWQWLKQYLAALGPAPVSGESWYVFYRFSGGLPDWKDLKNAFDSVLKPFMVASDRQPFRKRIAKGLTITVSRASGPGLHQRFFAASGYTDAHQGGWLLSELQVNLLHCIQEKSQKVTPYKARYPEWWLVLPDHIGYGLDEFDQELFREQVTVPESAFDKIVLLDPRNPGRFMQVVPGP